MGKKFDISEPKIRKDDVLILSDPDFNVNNVCLVTGAGGGIGRATAIAAAANNLMTVGLDIDEKEGQKTQRLARDLGGQMIFIKTDLTRDEDLQQAVSEAAKLGHIKFLANIAGIQHINSIEDFPMERFDYMHRLMLRAPFHLSKLVLPHITKKPQGDRGHRSNDLHPCPHLHPEQAGL